MIKQPRAVLFDLDGTLLDTAADIGAALNRTLAEYGQAPLSDDAVRRMIGRGSPILIERAVAARQMTVDAAVRERMLQQFFHHYESIEESGQSTAVAYSGAPQVLNQLHAAKLKLAVVTNKQHRFAVLLLERLGLAKYLQVVIGGDTCQRRKPDPEPLLFACQSLGAPPGESFMVGDSVNDAEAARAAGITMACMTYGYNEGRDPRELPCAAFLDSMAELPGLLGIL